MFTVQEARNELASLKRAIASRIDRESVGLSLLDFSSQFLKVKSRGQFVPLAPDCDFHRDLCDTLAASVHQRGTQQAWLAPRGFAKSSYVSYAFPLWAACEQHEPYQLIISETDGLGRKMLRNIRRQLERNVALLDRYAEARRGPVWRDNLLELRNGCVIQSAGTGAAIRGAREGESRPSVILGDDLQKKAHIYSELKRERSWDWWQTDILPLGDPSTNFFVVGTALHRECIACQLQNKTGWASKTYRAIEVMPTRMDLWNEWEAILHERRSEDGEQATEMAASRALAFFDVNRVEMEK